MIIAVDKPSGISSFDIIRRIKHHPLLAPIPPTKKTKIWHAGTLDPLATWLMLIATHRDTKRLHTLLWHGKSYEAIIDLSQISDTRDTDSRKEKTQYEIIINTNSEQNSEQNWEENWNKLWIRINGIFVPEPNLTTIQDILTQAVSETLFPLPPFSAKKVRWKKLYEYARAWEPIFLDSHMDFCDITLLDYSFPFLTLDVAVTSGTYIRSLAYWIGQQLWTWGIISSLRRTSIDTYKMKDMKREIFNDLPYAILEQ